MTQPRQPAVRQTQTRAATSPQPAPAAERAASGRPLDARSRLLHLQRTAGNRAVGLLLAQHQDRGSQPQSLDRDRTSKRSGALPPIQRLVGFEVELSIPTFRRGNNLNLGKRSSKSKPAAPIISSFLSGGLIYATPIGSLTTPYNNTIALKADHDRLEKDSATLYDELLPMTGTLPQNTLVPAKGWVGLSNLEYATDALDEMAPDSNLRFKALATAIDGHTRQTMAKKPKSAVSTIPNSNPETHTGIPVKEMFDWLVKFEDVGLPSLVMQALSVLQSHVSWRISPQATVGILPSGLEYLFMTPDADAVTGPDTKWRRAKDDATMAIQDGIQRLRHDPVLGARIATWMKNATAIDRDAFFGTLMVGLSYAVGQAMNRTDLLEGSTSKNAVPFLVKVTDIGMMATEATTGWHRNNPPGAPLLKSIATWFLQQIPQTGVTYWKGAPYLAKDPLDPASQGDVFTPRPDPTNELAYLLRRLLTGEGATGGMRAGSALQQTDPASQHIGGSAAVGGQRGIPLEYRWITPREAKSGDLWNVFESVLAEVRGANMRTLSASMRNQIRATWD